MYKCLMLKPITLSIMLLPLAGCSLPMNQATKDKPISVASTHWFNDENSAVALARGQTAFLPLDDAFISIASRIHLIRNAKNHIDLQYYIWKDDFIGHMMLQELLKAADRGVKVRLLIDDQNGTQLDDTLKVLALHPNFSIKIFNPYKYRHFRAIDYAFRLKHVNHRMHNKLIIADGAIAVTGGRNISREYFDASENFQFTDLDILFYGTAVQEANTVFQQFWNDDLSYGVPQLLGKSSTEDLRELRRLYELDAVRKNNVENRIEYAQKILSKNLEQKQIRWAPAHFIADNPNKIRGEAQGQQLIYKQIQQLMGTPTQNMELVSAYFVPTQKGTDYLSALAQNKVKVRVLTNSLAANDVAIVHSFYQKYRQDLLKNGVKMYEFKPYIERNKRTWYEVMTGNIIPAKGKNASSLHAKFFDIDGMVFIGSFNFDPRSANLNTEVGLVVESEQLQNEISASLDHYLPHIAYEVKLDQNNNLIWLEQKNDGSIKEWRQEPETTTLQRLSMKWVSYLPIEWLM